MLSYLRMVDGLLKVHRISSSSTGWLVACYSRVAVNGLHCHTPSGGFWGAAAFNTINTDQVQVMPQASPAQGQCLAPSPFSAVRTTGPRTADLDRRATCLRQGQAALELGDGQARF